MSCEGFLMGFSVLQVSFFFLLTERCASQIGGHRHLKDTVHFQTDHEFHARGTSSGEKPRDFG